ncbi:protocadherin gamma-A4-like [Haliotis rufescens]|uniref:protocadherin gamma-A4-like n=1 Tax=Haliotis rufescens TaxID=6454 RepID=UPI00201EE82C|nr:protocadherin gamma-A4-like [Haliotis rufescens]
MNIMKSQIQCILLLSLLLMSTVQCDQQKTQVYTSCSQLSAIGTLRTSVPESNSLQEIESNKQRYDVDLGITTNNDLTFTHINPYFNLTRAPRTDGQTGSTWHLQVVRPLDREGATPLENKNVIEYTLKCTANHITVYFLLLRVNVADVNDCSPVFINVPYSFSINELTPIGTTVFSAITATDRDMGDNGRITYHIRPGSNSGADLFSLPDPNVGVVTLKSTLDFTKHDHVVLEVEARDNPSTGYSHYAYTAINVNIVDGDDQGPQFIYPSCIKEDGICFNPSYTATITAGVTHGELHVLPDPVDTDNPHNPVVISARDRDTLNMPLTFSIVQTEPEGYASYFSIATRKAAGATYTGILHMTSPLPAPANMTQLRVLIKATETSEKRHYERAIVYINVKPSSPLIG